jgi:peptidoglycan/LPS O-acetylase OafA/YrhL
MQYQKSLDGLRALAVSLVLLEHFPRIENAELLNTLLLFVKKSGLGYIGVEVFFVLSGYLITSILLEDLRHNRERIVRDFYIKRALRILPVFVLTITVCIVLFPGYNYFYPAAFLSNYYFSYDPSPHPLRHFWSLAVEEQYYIFWPVVVVSIGLASKRYMMLFAIIIGISLCTIIIRDFFFPSKFAQALIYRSLESRMLALATGGMFAVFGIPKIKQTTLYLILIGFLAIVATFLVLNKAGYWDHVRTVKSVGYLAVAVTLFLVAAKEYKPFNLAFTSLPAVAVGRVSYGLYVYHVPVFFYFGVAHVQPGRVGASPEVAASAAATLAIVTISSWFLMEKPLLSLKKRLTSARSKAEQSYTTATIVSVNEPSQRT